MARVLRDLCFAKTLPPVSARPTAAAAATNPAGPGATRRIVGISVLPIPKKVRTATSPPAIVPAFDKGAVSVPGSEAAPPLGPDCGCGAPCAALSVINVPPNYRAIACRRCEQSEHVRAKHM